MIEADKLKIREAFLKAVSESSRADEPIAGWVSPDGTLMTQRRLVEAILEDEEYYGVIDAMVESGEYTLDEIIERTVKSISVENIERSLSP